MSALATSILALVAVAILSFGSGLATPRYRFAPIIAAGLIVAGYLAVVALMSTWATSCWKCSDNQSYDNRGQILSAYLVITGVIAFFDLMLIWVGARLSRRLGRQSA